MDLSVRDWLIVIGCLLAAAVLLDGYRRMRSDRQEAIRMSSRKRREGREDGDDELINPELPGGSARVVAVRESPSLHVKRAGADQPKKSAKSAPTPSSREARQEPEFGDDDDILFTDPADEFASPSARSAPVEPHWDASEDVDPDFSETDLEPIAAVSSRDSVAAPEASLSDHMIPDNAAPESAEPEVPFGRDESDHVVPEPSLSADRAERVAVEPPAEIAASRRSKQESASTSKSSEGRGDEYSELLVLNVVAPKDTPYNGADMLQILLACDVRYGKMNIFHRYEKPDGTGAVQFSIANLVEPGDFDLDGIEEFTTPGLVFFMNLPGPEKSMKAFDAMVETAKCLVSNLGGELRDQSHSVATKQTLEHYRQRIRDFERRQLTLM
ncbi:cell division protein ZipA [Spongiibacter taiwanensis]|uniref:cell division protein ZipA n=1 Tax=Spongiibacter taiwanensis TaxID=1748242 RepID=UPI00203575B3|nr:cell division protein ZipA [Spongiibacter taiwanensis]USA43176.1 cell division protein ZipA [Spongiibacter taiwanensis]